MVRNQLTRDYETRDGDNVSRLEVSRLNGKLILHIYLSFDLTSFAFHNSFFWSK